MVGSDDPREGKAFDLARCVGQGPPRAYSPLELLLLYRLSHLIAQRQEYHNLPVPADWRVKLIDKSIYSTYCDCVALGIGNDARQLVHAQGADQSAL